MAKNAPQSLATADNSDNTAIGRTAAIGAAVPQQCPNQPTTHRRERRHPTDAESLAASSVVHRPAPSAFPPSTFGSSKRFEPLPADIAEASQREPLTVDFTVVRVPPKAATFSKAARPPPFVSQPLHSTEGEPAVASASGAGGSGKPAASSRDESFLNLMGSASRGGGVGVSGSVVNSSKWKRAPAVGFGTGPRDVSAVMLKGGIPILLTSSAATTVSADHDGEGTLVTAQGQTTVRRHEFLPSKAFTQKRAPVAVFSQSPRFPSPRRYSEGAIAGEPTSRGSSPAAQHPSAAEPVTSADIADSTDSKKAGAPSAVAPRRAASAPRPSPWALSNTRSRNFALDPKGTPAVTPGPGAYRDAGDQSVGLRPKSPATAFGRAVRAVSVPVPRASTPPPDSRRVRDCDSLLKSSLVRPTSNVFLQRSLEVFEQRIVTTSKRPRLSSSLRQSSPQIE